MKEILSACTCNIVHNELYKFDDAVTDRPPKIDSAVSALRCFQLRGRSEYIKDIIKKLQYEEDKEDISCPRFLCKVFRSICRVRNRDDLAPQIDNYWGAYLVVGVDLWVVSQRDDYILPYEFQAYTDKIKLFLRKCSSEDDFRNLCNIIDGLKQVISLSEDTYDSWQGAKKMLGIPTIVNNIYQRFSDSVLQIPRWYDDGQYRKSAFDLVNIWCNLERMYVTKLKNLLNSTINLQEVSQAENLLRKEVKDLRGRVANLVKAIGSAGAIADGSFIINKSFEIASFELDKFETEYRAKLDTLKAKDGDTTVL